MTFGQGDDHTQQLVIIDRDELQSALEVAQQQGVEAQVIDESGFEPVTTVTLFLIGSSLAVGAVAYVLDQRKGGQVIDVRESAPKLMYRSRDVQYGLVVIFAADGKVIVDVKEPKQMFGQVLSSLTSILGDMTHADAGNIATTAKHALGNAATVEVQPIAASAE